MSWIQKLYESYDNAICTIKPNELQLWPLSHAVVTADVEMVIGEKGDFRRVKKLAREEAPTLIPVTESSVGRTSGIEPHPLCDEIGYCAQDYPESDKKKVDAYLSKLRQWSTSRHSHPVVLAVLGYLEKGCLWADLRKYVEFPVSRIDAKGKKTKVADHKLLIRWRVERPNTPVSGTWEDKELIQSWVAYDKELNPENGICMVLGQEARICRNYPRFIRYRGDKAKLISANDKNGYTFRGRFTDDTGLQACSIGYETTQKAHNALRWLIQHQGYRNGDQAIVSWAVNGKEIPDPMGDSRTLMLTGKANECAAQSDTTAVADTGQSFARRFNKMIAGYRAQLGPTDDIVVMAVDSATATTGRMAITFYRELTGSEFLERIEHWHIDFAWPQDFGGGKRFIGVPAPNDIAEAIYGRRTPEGELKIDKKLKKATIERLLPCIIDAQPLPRDLVESVVCRACNRSGLDHWEWEKILGIACSLYRGAYNQREYQMALEEDRTTRDYLYGRLLAIADHIEGIANHTSGENRDTAAGRLMQRFADRPASTWRTIELALNPARSRLRSKRSGFFVTMEKLLDDVTCKLAPDDFTSDTRLSGEFLLGYHCQRQALRQMIQDNKKRRAEDKAKHADQAEPADELLDNIEDESY
jgi:CRISPR-associated protein Csd1